MRYLLSGGGWCRKAVGVLLLTIFLPLPLSVFVRTVNEMARVALEVLELVIPCVVVVVVLVGVRPDAAVLRCGIVAIWLTVALMRRITGIRTVACARRL